MNGRAALALMALPVLINACSGTADQTARADRDPAQASSAQALRAIGTSVDSTLDPIAPVGTVADPIPPNTVFVPPVSTIYLPVDPPPNSDLRPDGAMRYYSAGSTWGVQVDVVNVGTTPATGASGTVSIGPYTFTGSLYQYYGGTSTAANTVNPGERGYIKIDVPPNLLSLCGVYPVTIDLGHTMQAGTNPFANDSRSVIAYQSGAACRLTWYRPINGATLGHEPDAKVAGKSLRDIVSSAEIARADGNRCSACHNALSTYPYRPNVGAGQVSNPLIDPLQPASGTEAWIGTSDPWLPKFLELPDSGSPSAKPPYLKEAFKKWLLDGAIH